MTFEKERLLKNDFRVIRENGRIENIFPFSSQKLLYLCTYWKYINTDGEKRIAQLYSEHLESWQNEKIVSEVCKLQ